MPNVIIYTANRCSYCLMAKRLLDNKQVKYQEINIDQDDSKRDEMLTKSGRRTVPQIFIDQLHIGGCDDLYALDRSGKLDPLLTNH